MVPKRYYGRSESDNGATIVCAISRVNDRARCEEARVSAGLDTCGTGVITPGCGEGSVDDETLCAECSTDRVELRGENAPHVLQSGLRLRVEKVAAAIVVYMRNYITCRSLWRSNVRPDIGGSPPWTQPLDFLSLS